VYEALANDGWPVAVTRQPRFGRARADRAGHFSPPTRGQVSHVCSITLIAAAIGDQVMRAYKAPPRAPVLYIKPRTPGGASRTVC